ncbi:unnamed protein product [Linum tenue]|uniref:Uncharacterized protein n=1 Tax=Linum tenue TaxID=586396 RepID=A0AAV0JDP6_9ROSI|nr:unnamed protein product [Linum tenue]
MLIQPAESISSTWTTITSGCFSRVMRISRSAKMFTCQNSGTLSSFRSIVRC